MSLEKSYAKAYFKHAASALGLLWAHVGGVAHAAPEETLIAPTVERQSAEVTRMGVVSFKHAGSFRFRGEWLKGGSLTGESSLPVADPLNDEDSLAWATMRLRYSPSIHVGTNLSIHLGLDILDNLILGSTHPNMGGSAAWDLSQGQASPSSGRYGTRDVFGVRELYGRWFAFNLLDLRAGRMVEHFGLGLQRNRGEGWDSDFGSSIDRVSAGASFGGIHVEAAWEFTSTGFHSGLLSDRNDGQPIDLGAQDDARTFFFRAGKYVRDAQEAEAREQRLDSSRTWDLEWSAMLGLTSQSYSTGEQPDDRTVSCQPSHVLQNGEPLLTYDCVQSVKRDAFLLRPGLWLRAETRPCASERIRLEVEAGALLGSIKHPQDLDEEDDQEKKDLISFGVAAEIQWDHGPWQFGLHTGFATGDNGPYLGVRDGTNVLDTDDDSYPSNDDIRLNRRLTGFTFNPDYRLDLILFRQVIGTVTNAFYAKPYVAVEFFKNEDALLRARLDVLYAAAFRPSGTPAGGKHWGIEVDAHIEGEFNHGLFGGLSAGVLVPMDALQNDSFGSSDPDFALRAHMGWRF